MRHVVSNKTIARNLIAACFFSFSCFAQAPAFDAASIHAGDPRIGGEPNVQVTSDGITIRNQRFLFIVQWAYDVPPAQIDGPAWFRDTPFDIVAKSAGHADETQMRLMLRTLLADRFGLKLHKESRAMQVYAITLAKGGPKFQESQTEGAFALERTNSMILSAHHARMEDLAQGISGEIGRPVVDATGLTGRYEIHMDLSPYLVKPPGEGGQGQLDMMGILFTGFQDLLGLKLESRKESVDVLVVDHAEKTPTEN